MHMLVAIALVGVLIYLVTWAQGEAVIIPASANLSGVRGLVGVAIGLSLVQILLGTQVRESIDIIAKALGGGGRSAWIDQLGATFYVHRSFSLLLLAVNGWMAYKVLMLKKEGGRLYRATWALVLCIGLEILLGMALAYWGMPALAQPLHLLLAAVMIGLQLYILTVLSIHRHVRVSTPISVYS